MNCFFPLQPAFHHLCISIARSCGLRAITCKDWEPFLLPLLVVLLVRLLPPRHALPSQTHIDQSRPRSSCRSLQILLNLIQSSKKRCTVRRLSLLFARFGYLHPRAQFFFKLYLQQLKRRYQLKTSYNFNSPLDSLHLPSSHTHCVSSSCSDTIIKGSFTPWLHGHCLTSFQTIGPLIIRQSHLYPTTSKLNALRISISGQSLVSIIFLRIHSKIRTKLPSTPLAIVSSPHNCMVFS